MTSSAPPILPLSVPQATPAVGSSAESQLPIATPALRSFVNNISSQVRDGLSQRRPWSELVDRSAFSRPENVFDALALVRRNYSYFRVNYVALIVVVLAFSLLTNPGSLFLLLGLLCAWIFYYLFRPSDQPLVLFGRSFSERETLGVLVVGSVFIIFPTSVRSSRLFFLLCPSLPEKALMVAGCSKLLKMLRESSNLVSSYGFGCIYVPQIESLNPIALQLRW